MRKKSMSFAGSVLSSGDFTRSPGRVGRTMRGVTMMARSVSVFLYCALLESDALCVLVVLRSAEERPAHGHASEPRQLVLRVGADVLQQAADDEALTVAQLDGGASAARDERRKGDAGNLHEMAEVELTYLRLDDEIDQAAPEHGGRE